MTCIRMWEAKAGTQGAGQCDCVALPAMFGRRQGGRTAEVCSNHSRRGSKPGQGVI